MILRGGVDIIVAVYRLLSLVDGLWVLHGWLWLGAALSELSYRVDGSFGRLERVELRLFLCAVSFAGNECVSDCCTCCCSEEGPDDVLCNSTTVVAALRGRRHLGDGDWLGDAACNAWCLRGR